MREWTNPLANIVEKRCRTLPVTSLLLHRPLYRQYRCPRIRVEELKETLVVSKYSVIQQSMTKQLLSTKEALSNMPLCPTIQRSLSLSHPAPKPSPALLMMLSSHPPRWHEKSWPCPPF